MTPWLRRIVDACSFWARNGPARTVRGGSPLSGSITGPPPRPQPPTAMRSSRPAEDASADFVRPARQRAPHASPLGKLWACSLKSFSSCSSLRERAERSAAGVTRRSRIVGWDRACTSTPDRNRGRPFCYAAKVACASMDVDSVRCNRADKLDGARRPNLLGIDCCSVCSARATIPAPVSGVRLHRDTNAPRERLCLASNSST